MATAETEGKWLATLDRSARARFLASLCLELTIAGRDSYVVQGDGLTNPELLRGVNEILNRVSACLFQLLSGDTDASFERSMANWVLESSNSELRARGETAWKRAKERLNRAN